MRASDADLPPPTLFKYRSCDHSLEHPYKRDRDIIVDGLVWAGSPLAFNDPFDCFPRIDLRGTDEELTHYIGRAIKRNATTQGRKERRTLLARSKRDFRRGSPFSQADGEEAWRQVLAKVGVVSLAERPDDLLMWGYYGASHSGYCVEFKTAEKPFTLAHRVRYAEERPSFRVLDRNRKDLMERLLLGKSAMWRHEHEWRVFFWERVGAREFPFSQLASITLGANISPADEAALRRMVEERGAAVPFKRAALDSRNYAITIRDA